LTLLVGHAGSGSFVFNVLVLWTQLKPDMLHFAFSSINGRGFILMKVMISLGGAAVFCCEGYTATKDAAVMCVSTQDELFCKEHCVSSGLP